MPRVPQVGVQNSGAAGSNVILDPAQNTRFKQLIAQANAGPEGAVSELVRYVLENCGGRTSEYLEYAYEQLQGKDKKALLARNIVSQDGAFPSEIKERFAPLVRAVRGFHVPYSPVISPPSAGRIAQNQLNGDLQAASMQRSAFFILESPRIIAGSIGAENVTLLIRNVDGTFTISGTSSRSMPMGRTGPLASLTAFESVPSTLVPIQGPTGEIRGYLLIENTSMPRVPGDIGSMMSRYLDAASRLDNASRTNLGGNLINLSAFKALLEPRLASPTAETYVLVVNPSLKVINAIPPGFKLTGNAALIAIGRGIEAYFAGQGINARVEVAKDGTSLWIILPEGVTLEQTRGLNRYLSAINEVEVINPRTNRPEKARIKLDLKTTVVRIPGGTSPETAMVGLDNVTNALNAAERGAVRDVVEIGEFMRSGDVDAALEASRQRNWNDPVQTEIRKWLHKRMTIEFEKMGFSRADAERYAEAEIRTGGYIDPQTRLLTHKAFILYASSRSAEGKRITIVAFDGHGIGSRRDTFGAESGTTAQSIIVRDRVPAAAIEAARILNERAGYEAVKIVQARYGANSDEFFWILEIDPKSRISAEEVLRMYDNVLNDRETRSTLEKSEILMQRSVLNEYLRTLNEFTPEQRKKAGLPAEGRITIDTLIKLGWIKDAGSGNYLVDIVRAPSFKQVYYYQAPASYTLAEIARALNIPVELLESENGLKRGDSIRKGERIRIPGVFGESLHSQRKAGVGVFYDVYVGVEMGSAFRDVPPGSNEAVIERTSNELERKITEKKKAERRAEMNQAKNRLQNPVQPKPAPPPDNRSTRVEPRQTGAIVPPAVVAIENSSCGKFIHLTPDGNGARRIALTAEVWNSLVELGKKHNLPPQEVARSYLFLREKIGNEFTPEKVSKFLESKEGQAFLLRHQNTLKQRVIQGGPGLLLAIVALLAAEEIAQVIGLDPSQDPVGHFAFIILSVHTVNVSATAVTTKIVNGELTVFIKGGTAARRTLLATAINSYCNRQGAVNLAKGTVTFPFKVIKGMGPGLFASELAITLAELAGIEDPQLLLKIGFGAFFIPDILRIIVPADPRVQNAVLGREGVRGAVRTFGLRALGSVTFEMLGALGAPFILGIGLDIWTWLWSNPYEMYVDERAADEDVVNMINSGGRPGQVAAFLYCFSNKYSKAAVPALRADPSTRAKIYEADRIASEEPRENAKKYLRVYFLTMYNDINKVDLSALRKRVQLNAQEEIIYSIYAQNASRYANATHDEIYRSICAEWERRENIAEHNHNSGVVHSTTQCHGRTNVPLYIRKPPPTREEFDAAYEKINLKYLQETLAFLHFIRLDCNKDVRRFFDKDGLFVGDEAEFIAWLYGYSGPVSPQRMLINERRVNELTIILAAEAGKGPEKLDALRNNDHYFDALRRWTVAVLAERNEKGIEAWQNRVLYLQNKWFEGNDAERQFIEKELEALGIDAGWQKKIKILSLQHLWLNADPKDRHGIESELEELGTANGWQEDPTGIAQATLFPILYPSYSDKKARWRSDKLSVKSPA